MIFKLNNSLVTANSAKRKFIKKYNICDWYYNVEVKNDSAFGYFLNVITDKHHFDEVKDLLPLSINNTFIIVNAI